MSARNLKDLQTIVEELTLKGVVVGFHKEGCRWYNCKNCIEVFQTREEAIGNGYRSCGQCKL